MRAAISLILACALVAAGICVLYFDLSSATGFRGKLAIMGGFLIALGLGWLWSDFFAKS